MSKEIVSWWISKQHGRDRLMDPWIDGMDGSCCIVSCR